jgi:hypothetical protein
VLLFRATAAELRPATKKIAATTTVTGFIPLPHLY